MDVYQRRRLVALSVLAGVFIVFVLLIRSCGDDDEPSTEPLAGATGAGATSQTRAGYIASADAICLETNTAVADIDEASEAAVATEASALGNQLDQLQTLLPPQDGQDALDRYLEALSTQVQQLDRQSTAIERGDTVSADEIALRADEAATEAAEAAERFGFRVCGNPEQVEGGGAGDEGEGTDETEAAPTEPAPTETAPVVPETTAPPAEPDSGAVGTEPPAPPADTGGDTGDTGGISP